MQQGQNITEMKERVERSPAKTEVCTTKHRAFDLHCPRLNLEMQ